jgi:predicted RNA-binding Zn-ribbon protein involved in translation (DUF1610 family)
MVNKSSRQVVYSCPGCRKVLAHEDRHRAAPALTLLDGVQLETPAKQAPRLRCQSCGRVVILLEGSLA